jgi:hypothetical protein
MRLPLVLSVVIFAAAVLLGLFLFDILHEAVRAIITMLNFIGA